MSKFSKDKFERAITTGAKVLGGDLDVDVVFIGDRAFTNGSTITIPSLPEDVELTLDQVNMLVVTIITRRHTFATQTSTYTQRLSGICVGTVRNRKRRCATS